MTDLFVLKSIQVIWPYVEQRGSWLEDAGLRRYVPNSIRCIEFNTRQIAHSWSAAMKSEALYRQASPMRLKVAQQHLDCRPVDQLTPRTVIDNRTVLHDDDSIKAIQMANVVSDTNQPALGEGVEQQIPHRSSQLWFNRRTWLVEQVEVTWPVDQPQQ